MTHIPIAISTGSLYPLSTLQSINQLRGMGFRDIELVLQANEFYLTFERKLSMPILPELLALVQSGELHVCSIHAPGIRAEHANNFWARKEYLIQSIEVCRLLGGSIVVVHPLHLLTSQESALDYLSSNGTSLQSALLPGINVILEKARSANVTLAMENIQDWLDEIFFNYPDNVSRFLRDMEHPALGFTFDLMHAQASGFLEEFVDSIPNDIINVHVSDLIPPTRRVSVGKGVINWPSLIPVLQTLPKLRQLTLELSNSRPDELIQSIVYLSKLMS